MPRRPGRLALPPSLRTDRAIASARRRGLEVGRRWGSTDATPEEIDRVREAMRDVADLATVRELDAAPGVGGFLLQARLAFLIRPELLAGDLDEATAAAAGFWRKVLGDDYGATRFRDDAEAFAWLRGFAEGAGEVPLKRVHV